MSNMKYILILVLILFSNYLIGQLENIDSIKLYRGKIISKLPYGKKLFIEGNLNDYPEWNITKVELKTYDTRVRIYGFNQGRINSKLVNIERNLSKYTENKYLHSADKWIKTSDNDKIFRLLIDKNLDFNTIYIFKLYYQLKIELSEEENQELANNIKELLFKRVEEKENDHIEDLVRSDLSRTIEEEYTNYIQYKAWKLVGEGGEIGKPSFKTNTKFEESEIGKKIDDLAMAYANQVRDLRVAKRYNDSIKVYKKQLDNIEANKKLIGISVSDSNKKVRELDSLRVKEEEIVEGINYYQQEIVDKNESTERSQKIIDIIFDTEIEGYLDEVETTTSVGLASITSTKELESIMIGSAFGAGITFLNTPKEQLGYGVGYGYLGLKFYFLPVDRRLPDPYLDKRRFLNKLSFLVGFAVGNDLKYRGQELDKLVLNTYPLLGLSWDLNRYFSVDAGSLFFMYESVSPLKEDKILRLAPFISLSFDIDLFNRFKSLVSGDKYKLTDTKNP